MIIKNKVSKKNLGLLIVLAMVMVQGPEETLLNDKPGEYGSKKEVKKEKTDNELRAIAEVKNELEDLNKVHRILKLKLALKCLKNYRKDPYVAHASSGATGSRDVPYHLPEENTLKQRFYNLLDDIAAEITKEVGAEISFRAIKKYFGATKPNQTEPNEGSESISAREIIKEHEERVEDKAFNIELGYLLTHISKNINKCEDQSSINLYLKVLRYLQIIGEITDEALKARGIAVESIESIYSRACKKKDEIFELLIRPVSRATFESGDGSPVLSVTAASEFSPRLGFSLPLPLPLPLPPSGSGDYSPVVFLPWDEGTPFYGHQQDTPNVSPRSRELEEKLEEALYTIERLKKDSDQGRAEIDKLSKSLAQLIIEKELLMREEDRGYYADVNERIRLLNSEIEKKKKAQEQLYIKLYLSIQEKSKLEEDKKELTKRVGKLSEEKQRLECTYDADVQRENQNTETIVRAKEKARHLAERFGKNRTNDAMRELLWTWRLAMEKQKNERLSHEIVAGSYTSDSEESFESDLSGSERAPRLVAATDCDEIPELTDGAFAPGLQHVTVCEPAVPVLPNTESVIENLSASSRLGSRGSGNKRVTFAPDETLKEIREFDSPYVSTNFYPDPKNENEKIKERFLRGLIEFLRENDMIDWSINGLPTISIPSSNAEVATPARRAPVAVRSGDEELFAHWNSGSVGDASSTAAPRSWSELSSDDEIESIAGSLDVLPDLEPITDAHEDSSDSDNENTDRSQMIRERMLRYDPTQAQAPTIPSAGPFSSSSIQRSEPQAPIAPIPAAPMQDVSSAGPVSAKNPNTSGVPSVGQVNVLSSIPTIGPRRMFPSAEAARQKGRIPQTVYSNGARVAQSIAFPATPAHAVSGLTRRDIHPQQPGIPTLIIPESPDWIESRLISKLPLDAQDITLPRLLINPQNIAAPQAGVAKSNGRMINLDSKPEVELPVLQAKKPKRSSSLPATLFGGPADAGFSLNTSVNTIQKQNPKTLKKASSIN